MTDIKTNLYTNFPSIFLDGDYHIEQVSYNDIPKDIRVAHENSNILFAGESMYVMRGIDDFIKITCIKVDEPKSTIPDEEDC